MIDIVIFGAAGLLLAGVAYYIIRGRRKDEPKNVWLVPFDLLDSLMNELEHELIADGWGRKDYSIPSHDCSEYAPEHCRRLEVLLKPLVPRGKVLFLKPLSFPRMDGKGRHQVAAVRTDRGMVFIETYRIDGSLYRSVDPEEIKAGYYIKDWR